MGFSYFQLKNWHHSNQFGSSWISCDQFFTKRDTDLEESKTTLVWCELLLLHGGVLVDPEYVLLKFTYANNLSIQFFLYLKTSWLKNYKFHSITVERHKHLFSRRMETYSHVKIHWIPVKIHPRWLKPNSENWFDRAHSIYFPILTKRKAATQSAQTKKKLWSTSVVSKHKGGNVKSQGKLRNFNVPQNERFFSTAL
jgi:hypothetical protein